MQSGVSTRGDLVLIDMAQAQVSGEGVVIRRWGQGKRRRGGEGTSLALPRPIHRRKRQTTPDINMQGNALSPAEGRAASSSSCGSRGLRQGKVRREEGEP